MQTNRISRPHSFVKLNSLTKTLCLLILSSLLALVSSNQKTKFVFEMFLHGARSPLNLDSNSKDIFNQKWLAAGELTSVGMRQHFLLGFRNSEVYGKALKISKYTPTEISISSTNYNRTIMSAYSQLQGFFPPATGPVLSAEQMLRAYPPIEFDFEPELKFLADNALKAQSNVFAIKILNRKIVNFICMIRMFVKELSPGLLLRAKARKSMSLLGFLIRTIRRSFIK